MTTLKSRSAATHLPNQPGDKPASTRSVSDPTPPTTAMAPPEPSSADAPNWWRDRHSVLLLISLYTAQGLPMGLAFGSIPFLLKERGSSYAHLAAFSFASLPYSLKLLIAPIVDSCYSPSFGRRKSWIVPVQLVAGLTMTLLADTIRRAVAEGNVALLTPVFLTLLAMCATQDIAVDGWSLTMLQKQNVSYASTCQSLGLTIGYFSTFTLFLAFSNAPFCDNYIRPLIFFSNQTGPVADLASVLRTAGLYYLLLTLYIALFKKELPPTHSAKKTDAELEDPHFDQEHFDHPRKTRSAVLDSITSTYSDLLIVVRKPAVRSLVSMLLISKLGFSAYDNVAPLKLLEHGFSKESMASMAVLASPFTLIGTLVTGNFVAKRSPLEVYLYGYALRFILSLTGPACVSFLKAQEGVVSTTFYFLILFITIMYSFASECLMFVGVGAFFLNVSSSSIHVAGSYLTLLNTSSNMGGTWHKALTLWLVDRLTWREDCIIPPDAAAGTLCPVKYDGYYVISTALVPVAAVIGLYFAKTLPWLAKLPDSSWKASKR